MAKLIALTSTGPLSGKSTLAKYLEREYGFIRADHSRSLVSSFVFWANSQPNPERSGLILPLTVEEVYRNKDYYRPMLQKHGYAAGMNTGVEIRGFMFKTLADAGCLVTQARCPGSKPVVCPGKDVVYDPFRGEEQAQIMRELGFTLVQLEISEEARVRRAVNSGVNYYSIWEAMNAHPELEMGIMHPDITLNGELPVEVLAKALIDRSMYRLAREELDARG